jgi:hypothetical protein
MRELVGHIFTAGIHILILSTMVIMTSLTFKLIRSAPNLIERKLRYLALTGGLLLFFAADTLKIDLASLIVRSLALIYPANVAVAECAIPATAGTFSAWFLLRGLQEREKTSKFVKLLVMLTGFLLFTFADLYATSMKLPQKNSGLTLLPNVSFVLALVLYSVFRYQGEDTTKTKTATGAEESSRDASQVDWRTEV